MQLPGNLTIDRVKRQAMKHRLNDLTHVLRRSAGLAVKHVHETDAHPCHHIPVRVLRGTGNQEITADVLKISALCARMLDEVQAAYRRKDAGKAQESAKLDDMIDPAHANLVDRLCSTMQSSPDLVPDASRMLWISHILERCADQATNIAGQVVFRLEGEMVKLN